MNFEDLCKAITHRFEASIKEPTHLANMPTSDAILLAGAMVCSALKEIEAALLALQPSYPPESHPTEILRGAAQAHASAPPVKVDVFPPGKEPPGVPAPIVPPVGM